MEVISIMFWVKACPRCKGDLFLDNGPYSQDIVCLQCGHRIYLGPEDEYQDVLDALCVFNLSTCTNPEVSNKRPGTPQEQKRNTKVLVK